MKETGKALVAWDEWGKNPARAAGAVTFNVLTTVFTGGAGGAVSRARARRARSPRLLSVAGKAGNVIDPMTYIAKGAGAGLSKIGDIAKGLKGARRDRHPDPPRERDHPAGGLAEAPGRHGAAARGRGRPGRRDQAARRHRPTPFRYPGVAGGRDETAERGGLPRPVPGRRRQPPRPATATSSTHVDNAPTDVVDQPASGTPADGADVPRVDSPRKEPALVGAGAHTAEQAGQHIRLGSDLDDVGRVGDDVTH